MRTTETGEATSQPVLLVVDAGDADRGITESALARRFGGDYTVIATGNAQEGFDLLSEFTVQGRDVALVAADLHLPSTGGIKFLGRAHELHPKAVRVLLVPMDEFHTRIPFTELPALQRANVPGQADYWILKGWTTPEEWLYPQVQEALTAWTVANRPRHLVYRIVGLQWDPRSHELRDVLTRSGVPFAFHGADSDEGQRLIRVLGIETSQLPALIQHDNSVLLNPSTEEVAAAHGVRTRPSPGIFDLVVIGSGPTG